MIYKNKSDLSSRKDIATAFPSIQNPVCIKFYETTKLDNSCYGNPRLALRSNVQKGETCKSPSMKSTPLKRRCCMKLVICSTGVPNASFTKRLITLTRIGESHVWTSKRSSSSISILEGRIYHQRLLISPSTFSQGE